MKNKLIIFEGIDGSGKSTQAKYFAKKLKAVYLKEPFFFKKIILSPIQHLTELFLFLADRAEVYFYVEKFLKKSHVVLDRSFPSTIAYQLEGRNLKKFISLEDYLKIDLITRRNINPNLVIVLDLPVKIALSRLKRKTKFEEFIFLSKVRRTYRKYAKKFNWQIVDASLDKESVTKKISEILVKEKIF